MYTIEFVAETATIAARALSVYSAYTISIFGADSFAVIGEGLTPKGNGYKYTACVTVHPFEVYDRIRDQLDGAGFRAAAVRNTFRVVYPPKGA